MPDCISLSWNMCLTFREKAHLEVMSSGDSSLHPSVSTSSTLKIDIVSPTVSQSELNEDVNANLGPQRDSSVIRSSSSSSDLEGHENPLSSSATLEINQSLQQRDVSSLDGSSFYEEGSDLTKKDNAKSAFEITSVRPATDDHDRSVVRNPVSTDSLRETLQGELGGKREAGESDDSIMTPSSEKPQTLSTADLDDSTSTKPLFLVGSPDEDECRVANDVCITTGVNANQRLRMATLPEDPMISANPVGTNASSNTSVVVLGGGGVKTMVGNGSNFQPNRFRRVNQYERGRWTVRDSLVTEEQGETMATTTSLQASQNTKQFPHHVRQPDAVGGEGLSNGTSPRSVHQRLEPTADPSHLQMSTELGNLPGYVGGEVGGLGLSDATSDKDSSSVHMDRSSTAAETLSRNTSMSSIVPEKSIDGEELLQDSEVESISGAAGVGGGGGGMANAHPHNQEQDLGELSTSTHPPVIPTSSVGAVAPPSSTILPRHNEPPPHSVSLQGDLRKESE